MLDEIVKKYKVLLDNEEASQEEIDEAVKVLTKAISKATLKADKTDLIVVVTDAKEYNLDLYTEESATLVVDILSKIEEIINDENVDQTVVDSLRISLESALANLELKDKVEDEIPEEDSDDKNDEEEVNTGTDNKPGNNNGSNSNGGNSGKLPQTGGKSSLMTVLLGMAAIAGGILFKKKR